MSSAHDVAESRQSLWLLAASPAIWAAHLVISYATAAVWCAKVAESPESLGVVRLAIAIYTMIAIAAIAVIGWYGYRKSTYGTAAVPHDADTPEDRHRFLGFSTLLLSLLSGVATFYVALAAVFIRTCY